MNTLFDTEATIQERFTQFDQENPDVYAHFKRFALELLKAGRTHYSADGILHRVRFETAANPHYAEKGERKINDHFSSRYARKLMAEDVRFADFFTTRKLKVA